LYPARPDSLLCDIAAVDGHSGRRLLISSSGHRREDEREGMSRIEMTEAEQAALWRQRLFEAEAGMTEFLVRQGAGPYIATWLAAKAGIFADFPEHGCRQVERWQRAFFRAQALCEAFLLANFGEEAIALWVAASANVYRAIECDGALPPAPDAIRRIARQAECYGSDYDIVAESPVRSEIIIKHCAIWDYRERARAAGIPITLKSPCTYCTKAMSANIRAKGCIPQYALRDREEGHGCCWQALAAADPQRE
jgi:hypothetical protein